jgi:anaerobic selenocysteine-containing dehydrogenase
MGEGAARSALLGRAILRAISGNLDVPGGEPLNQPYDTDQFAWLDTVGFDNLVDHPLRTRESVNAAETPIASITGYKAFRDAMAEVHPQGHTGCAYMLFASQPAIYKAVLERAPYPIRSIIVQGGEPLLAMGGAKKAYEALTSPNLDLLVVMDLFMTPTAQLADYVLPTAGFLERSDISAHWGLGNFFVAGQKVVEPMYDRHNDYDLWAGLGRRLLDPGNWPEDLEGMLDLFLAPSGKTFEEWADGPTNHHFPRPQWRKYERQGFATASGKVELVPTLFDRLGVDSSPTYTGPPYSKADADPDDYPLRMIPGSRVRELTASALRQTVRLNRIHPEPLCDIHPTTAESHGIADGDWIEIERPEGVIRQRARLTDGIRQDTINPDGYWWEPSEAPNEPHLSGVWTANANALTPADPSLSSFAGDQPLRGARCRIRRAEIASIS